MSRKLLLLALAVVSFAAVCVSLDLAAAMDSEAEADRPMDQPDRNMPGQIRGHMEPPRDEPPMDGPRPLGMMPGDMAPMDGGKGPQKRIEPRPEQRPMEPRSEQPEYQHDASPEVLSAHLKPMIDGDISEFDPGFVEDAIDYAMDNGMEDIAELLMKKLAANYESYLHTILHIGAIDTRASGFDDDMDEASDFELVDVDEEDPVDPMPFSEPAPSQYNPFRGFSEPLFVLLEL